MEASADASPARGTGASSDATEAKDAPRPPASPRPAPSPERSPRVAPKTSARPRPISRAPSRKTPIATLAIVFLLGAGTGSIATMLFAPRPRPIETTPAPVSIDEAEVTLGEDASDENAGEDTDEARAHPATASVAAIPEKTAALELLFPKGTRVRLDGQWLKQRMPARGIFVTPGKHTLFVVRGRQKRRLLLEVQTNEVLIVESNGKTRTRGLGE